MSGIGNNLFRLFSGVASVKLECVSCRSATVTTAMTAKKNSLQTMTKTKAVSMAAATFNALKLLLLACFLAKFDLSLCLSMTEVRIPKHIMRYEDAVLGCKFDLDGESLYSVKWYKDGFEFYRYVPRDMPPGQVFPLPGVDVDLLNSTDNVVVLRRVTLQSTGRYRCEVSGEAPSFQTVSGHEDMIVVCKL